MVPQHEKPQEAHVSYPSEKEFLDIVRDAPLVSIDLIVRDSRNRMLLGHRVNRPAKGSWFVPGGRIRKDEKRADAFKRLVKDELVILPDFRYENASFLGVDEHHYPDNVAGEAGFGTHYVVLKYELMLTDPPEQWPKTDQHDEMRWWSHSDAMDSDDVHRNVKSYLKDSHIPSDARFYGALMAHYIHYDKQMWGRTQMMFVIEAAALAGNHKLCPNWMGAALLCFATFMVIVLWWLIKRDRQNRDVNLNVMDKLANRVLLNSSGKRLVSVRSDLPWWTLRGTFLVNVVTVLIIVLNMALLWRYKN